MSSLEAARKLVKNGYSVVPVKEDKRPAIPSWKEYQTRLPTEEELKQWFSNEGRIAIIGGWNNIAVLDIDDVDLAKKLVDQFKDHAPLIQTPSGGLHIYLKEERPSKSGALIEGVADVKAKGGYFIRYAPGYKRLNEVGQPLSIENVREYATTVLAGHGYEVQNERIRYEETGVRLAEGSRNLDFTSIAGTLRNRGLDGTQILNALKGLNTGLADPLPDKELESLAHQANRWEV
jgi:hypothetical protein